ncbi:MAG: hypothetical protein ABI700_02255 [Chloroflexota bacterium]
MMPNYSLDQVRALFRLSKKLIDEPTAEGQAEVLDLLAQIATAEQAQETTLTAQLVKTTLRRADQRQSGQISEQPTAFTAIDTQGNEVKITLEVENGAEMLQILGKLHTKSESSWDQFTVLLYRESQVEDYAESERGREFALQLSTLGKTTLKFIPSAGEIILLEDLEVVLD